MADSFQALDAAGNTILIGALYDSINGIYYPNVPPEATRIDQFLSTNGDGSGTVNAIGNYSVVADDFYIEAPAGEKYVITRMVGLLQDSSFRPDRYTSAAALANGISLIQKITAVEIDMTPIAVTTVAEWAGYCHDLEHYPFGAGGADELISFRWTFAKAGASLVLNGDNSDQLIVRVNDDLSGLVKHRFLIQGYKFA